LSRKEALSISIRVTAALIEQDGKVLICRRAPCQELSGLWEFPGGKVEKDESDRLCLERELLEELGIIVSVGPVIASNTHHYDEFTITLVLMKTVITGGSVVPTVHDRVEWVLPTELRNWDLAPADIPLAEAVRSMNSRAV